MTSSSSGSRLRGGYFAVQGIAVAVWWTVMFFDPSMMGYFLPRDMPTGALLAFLPADTMFGAASLVAAWCAFRAHPRERLVAWFVAGAALYATLWCIGIWALSGEALAGVLCMLPCAMASLACAVWASRP